MQTEDIITGILEREQQGKPPWTSPSDAGGRTSWGISERAHPEAWANGPPSRAEAATIYRAEYVAPFFSVPHEALRVALVDDGVMSGVAAATKRLQTVLGVDADGVLGPRTIAAIAARPPLELLKAYVVERAVRITRLVQRRPSDLPNLTGWITRILSFLP